MMSRIGTVGVLLMLAGWLNACGDGQRFVHVSLNEPPGGPEDVSALEILRADARFATVLEAAEEHKLQVLLAYPDGDSGGLIRDGFRLDAEYLYPASTVKLPVALAALEFLHQNGATLDTPLTFHPIFEGETLETEDETNLETGLITPRHALRRVFLVSDNQSNNWFWELYGPAALAKRFEHAGLSSTQVVHRLSEFHEPEVIAPRPPGGVRGCRRDRGD